MWRLCLANLQPNVVSAIVLLLLLKVPLAEVAGAVKVTLTPGTAFPPASLTMICKGVKAVATVADWVPPPVIAMFAGFPGVFVSEKLGVELIPLAARVTLYGPPATVLAVKGAEIVPTEPTAELVVSTIVLPLLASDPLAPVAGAVRVTLTPGTGLLLASLTITCRGANAVPTVAD